MFTHKIGISVEKYMINGQFLNDINSSGAISNFEIFFILVLTRDFLLLGFTDLLFFGFVGFVGFVVYVFDLPLHAALESERSPLPGINLAGASTASTQSLTLIFLVFKIV